jgi:chemotaxis family two-component system response regulator Rcp1
MQAKPRVMIVEDNPADILLMRKGLNDCDTNFDCDYFSNGDDAINHLNYVKTSSEGSLPDIMILDLNLPGRNGMELLKEVKSDTTLQNIPIAIFSSMPHGNPLRPNHEVKADMYFSKPFDVHEYMELVCKICEELDKLAKENNKE